MNRIELLASLAKGSNCLADIGCDHGFISITAVSKYGVSKAYASDIGVMPLESAKKNIKAAGLHDSIMPILSSGFQNIPFDFDTAIIAGMGGLLIIDIIKKYLDKLKDKKLILQANTDREAVRIFLTNQGFKIKDEYAFYDMKKYYEILVFEKGQANYSALELKYGPLLLKEKNASFLEYHRHSLKRMEENLTKAVSKTAKDTLHSEVDELKKVVNLHE